MKSSDLLLSLFTLSTFSHPSLSFLFVSEIPRTTKKKAKNFITHTFAKKKKSNSPSLLLLHMSNKQQQQEEKETKHIVIAGAGIIGLSTAYYLSENFAKSQSSEEVEEKLRITLIDPSGKIAPAASGKAGGFLALNWNDYSPTRDLCRRSFELHSILAQEEELGAENIQYRRLTCASISVDDEFSSSKPSGKKLEGVEWVQDGRAVQELGDETTIAQVHPKMLCDALWAKVNANPNVTPILKKGKVGDFVNSKDDDDTRLIGAKVLFFGEEKEEKETLVECDALLYACGPWTKFGNCMQGVKYHSVILPTKNKQVLNQAVFFDGCGDPEVYPRPDATVYACGFPDEARVVTENPGEEEIRQDKVEEIIRAVKVASSGRKVQQDGNGDDEKEGETSGMALEEKPALVQSCYLPTTPTGIPMMGQISKDVYVASGHSCWGILMGPGTGECMASLIMTGQSTPFVDLRYFDPLRYV